jgi:hypothetical protein
MSSKAICLMIKNDHDYLQEWLDHHREIGFDRFYIYDNESDVPHKDLGDDVTITWWDENQYFEPHPPIKNPHLYNEQILDRLELTELRCTHWPWYPDRNDRQYKAYQHCLNNHGAKHQWIAFIDSDEFIMLGEGENLDSLLEEFTPYGQLLLQWRTFSSSSHLTKQPKLKEAYTEWFPDYEYKPIVMPSLTYAVGYIHAFVMYPPFKAVVETKELRIAYKNGHSSKRIWINHYWGKSRQDFEETKLIKKGGVTQKTDNAYEKKWDFIEKRAKYHMNKYVYNK